MRRPTHAELQGKILKARRKIAEGDWLAAEVRKLLPELELLDLWTAEEQTKALEIAVNEIRPEDYVGQRPPQRSYEEACKGAELFAFAWESRHMAKRLYLKFCLVKDTLYVVSFHEDKGRKEEETS